MPVPALHGNWLAAIDQLPCGLVQFDDDGRLRSANRYLRSLLGLEPGQSGPDSFAKLLNPASRILYLTGVAATLKLRGEVSETYLVMRHSDGSDVPVLVNISRRTQEDGTLNTAVVLLIRDRKRLGDELLRARRSAEQIPGMVFQYLRHADGRGTFPYASDAIQEWFGVTPVQARESATAVLACVHPEDRDAFDTSLAHSARTSTRWTMQFRVRGPDGRERWLEAYASPQPYGRGAILWHGYAGDVTQRRALEGSLRDKEIAERASQAKSAFLARASHELRTPLNAVLGFAQLLSTDPDLQANPRQQRHIGFIEAAGRNLLELIDEVLDIEQIESGTIELELAPIDVGTLMRESASLLSLKAAQRSIDLSIRAPQTILAMGDGTKLLQCLNNLVNNAIKYNVDGGHVTLSADADGDRIRIEVHDSGIGMTSEQLEHLFEPFNRLGAERTRTEGSGLGLVITRGLVQKMGGHLLVSSEPGVGSCFGINLATPCVDQSTTAAGASGTPSVGSAKQRSGIPDTRAIRAGTTRQRHVLYVEDNPVNTMLMESIFERLPTSRLSSAETGADAETRTLADPPDLLLLDMQLPDTDGIALLARLRGFPGMREVPAVAVSADALPEGIEAARSAGFSDYWVKPLDLDRTLGQLMKLLSD